MDKSKLTMFAAIEYFLNDICVDWGFCIPPKEAKKIMAEEHLEADEFACKILVAEQMNPEYEKQWRRKIGKRFMDQFGQEISKDEFKQSS